MERQESEDIGAFRALQQQAREAGVPERDVNMACDMEDLRSAIAALGSAETDSASGLLHPEVALSQSYRRILCHVSCA